jgi:signal transduction histidine kinase
MADPRRTSQVLVNLLANANRLGPEDSDIVLEISAEGDHVRVAVIDQGPGVSPEQRPALFTRFGRADAGSGRADHGAGLGLSVVKAIVESQHGQVGVDDRDGGGAAFWFTVPVADRLPAEEEESE